MALTQEQWFRKLRGWVPSWWFEQEHYNVAVFMGIAKIMAQVESDLEAHQGEAFIAVADEQFLDAHGAERNLVRTPGESDAAFAARVRNIINSSNRPSIEALVNNLLLVGECTLREHAVDAIFMSRDSFFNRREVYTDVFYNAFTIVVSNQGAGGAVDAMMASLANAVNDVKALGTLYRVSETLI